MALNLLQICTRALDDMSSFNIPTFIIGNSDPTAKTLLSAAKKVGEELARDYDWQELSKTATVTTEVGVRLYDLPSDYERISPDTMWDGTQFRYMRGQTTRREWAAITNNRVNPALTYWWRLFGGQIQLEPAATSVFSFNYEYLSNVYCKDMGGVDRADGWTDDTDLSKLPFDLFITGIRYYFSDSKNLPGAAKAGAEYDAIIQSRQSKNTPTQAVNMAAGVCAPGRYYDDRLNIPDRVDN